MIRLSPSTFRDLISGRRRGWLSTALRLCLLAAAVMYARAVWYRNRRFDKRPRRAQGVGEPVISVGNITLGGTGKTPVVAWIARWLRRHGVAVALISRGYGARAGCKNDEALELERLLPGVPHFQNADRVAAARQAVREADCRVLIADDAFQHRRLWRDLDLVLLDALEPFGWEHVFPRGMLREPLSGLARADVILLSRADMIDPSHREAIRQRVAAIAPSALWGEVVHAPAMWIDREGAEYPLDALASRRVCAFCGLGNPAGFFRTLEQCGVELVQRIEFPDHHRFSVDDLSRVARAARHADAEAIVCTGKDLVKIDRPETLEGLPLRALEIRIAFLTGESRLERLLRQRLGLYEDR